MVLTPTLLAGSFTLGDWAIVAAYLLVTTLIGARLAGKQATIRDFFLGGRKLPWWAISGSIIATEISAATLIGVPTISYAAGGNLTYLQLALGAIIARILVAIWFVPRYYEREIYSPYEYVGQRLGPRVESTTTVLFFVGAVLGQGARLYITAFVLSAISGLSLPASIWIIGAFAVLWTLLGGMTTVIWTDVIQFIVIVVGAIVALIFAVRALPGGVGEAVRIGAEAGKFQWIDPATDLSIEYTLWCGLLATPFLNLAAFGTDQVMAQRLFCCKDQRDARKAILASSVSLVVPLIMLAVGVALFAYFKSHPMTADEALRYKTDKTYLLPLFILRELPFGVRAIVVAAVFAAAISTLDGALTALAQASLKPFKALRGTAGSTKTALDSLQTRDVLLSKGLVVLWGVVLCLMAVGCISFGQRYRNVIDLALALVAYTYGPLLGIFLLAFLNTRRDDAGLPWAVPTAMLAVFSASVHDLYPRLLSGWGLTGRAADLALWIVALAAAVIFLTRWLARPMKVAQAVGLLAAMSLIVWLHVARFGPESKPLGWTWNFPIATTLTFTLGWLLGNRAAAPPSTPTPAIERPA